MTNASRKRCPLLSIRRVRRLLVTSLINWYRDGGDVQVRLPLLSTWLGHVDPASTYWYLHAVPELLAHAAHRLDAQAGSPTTESAS